MIIIDMACERSMKCSDCEGFTLNFEAHKEISKKRIRKIWKTITDKPFSHKLHAYVLKNEEYERVMYILRNCELTKAQNVLEIDEPKAVGLRTGLSEYWILIKKNSKSSFKLNLGHELEYIAKREA